MIRNYFPDVQMVSIDVLNQFHNLDPAMAPGRKIVKWAASLMNVQYGIVTRDNYRGWEEINWDTVPKDGRLVRLVY